MPPKQKNQHSRFEKDTEEKTRLESCISEAEDSNVKDNTVYETSRPPSWVDAFKTALVTELDTIWKHTRFYSACNLVSIVVIQQNMH